MGGRITRIYRKIFKKNRIYSKKKAYGYKERNEEDRKNFIEEIKDIDPANIVYIDEAGIDDNETYDYAWGPKGQRVYAMKSAERLSSN